jgi:hypothetical protein
MIGRSGDRVNNEPNRVGPLVRQAVKGFPGEAMLLAFVHPITRLPDQPIIR